MADAIEVVVRLGDSVLDVAYVTDRYALAGELLVDGAMVGGAPIERGTPIVTRRGLVDVSIARVDRPVGGVPRTPHGDRRALGYIAVSLAVHLVVWAVAPPPTEADPRTARVVERAPIRVTPRLHVTPRVQRGSLVLATNGGGSPAPGDAGAAGGNAKQLAGRIRIAKRADEPAIARANAVSRSREAGIFSSREIAHGFETLVGRAELSSGFDRTDVHAPINGGEGAGRGNFGLARDGTGNGGGCPGGECGIIAAGRYGTLGQGTGTGSGYGAAGGRGGLDGRTPTVPTVTLCAGPRPCYLAVGALDKSIIRRYIRRAHAKFTYCYERDLIATPDLAGEVTTDFLIAMDGTVTSATASGINERVSTCVADVLRGIQFPSSKDGVTRVTYPFTFRTAGS